ncbi:hypothetical protein Sango_1906300 [Sesamum angolense]|uniref:Uncharacterized protein n=1 Tax=Sesamum angolense TaxID=2727404 RepID=A0AAE2BR19_9LAMI|nr:hypothetical protein Sango_1906300 [Sesamum angolense]
MAKAKKNKHSVEAIGRSIRASAQPITTLVFDKATSQFTDEAKKEHVRENFGTEKIVEYVVANARTLLIVALHLDYMMFPQCAATTLGIEVQTLLVDDDVLEWGPKLSSEHVLKLCRLVTSSEVKQTIFQINNTKAPRPDGYSSCFFKKTWNVVGYQVCKGVMNIFRSGLILRQLNHTIIALVPKFEQSPSVADYRPISCCNVIYEAIKKIIAGQFSSALDTSLNIAKQLLLRVEALPTIFSWLKNCLTILEEANFTSMYY